MAYNEKFGSAGIGEKDLVSSAKPETRRPEKVNRCLYSGKNRQCKMKMRCTFQDLSGLCNLPDGQSG